MIQFVVIRDMSVGNVATGDAWQETKVFESSSTLHEVMMWAVGWCGEYSNKSTLPDHSSKRVTITIAHPTIGSVEDRKF